MTQQTGRLLIVYDNYSLRKEFIPAWGFSALVQYPQYGILFDMGGDPSILHGNLLEMGIDTEKIDSLAFSHAHDDHIGGFSSVLQFKNNIPAFIPKSFPQGFKDEISLNGMDARNITHACEIYQGIYTTGELQTGRVEEQSLVIKTIKGLVIITGCAHPGLLEIVDYCRKLFNENVYLLIGGFHLMDYTPDELSAMAQNLKEKSVQMIAPCHCSGDRTREVFADSFGENFIQVAAGSEIELPALVTT